MITKVLPVLILLLSLTACSSPATNPPEDRVIQSNGKSVLEQQLDWILSILNDHQGKTTKEDVTAHFHPTFLAQISSDQVLGIFQQLAQQLGTIQWQGNDPVITPSPGVQTLIAHGLTAKGGKIRLVLSIDKASGQINGLYVQPDAPPQPPAKPLSFQEADRLLKATAPDSALLVSEVKAGSCEPLHQLKSSEPKAIGSAFKLYVLLALVDQIGEKKLRWDDSLAIENRWKSLPSGTMQYEPDGTKFSLRKFAEQMISLSDNTATDHLFYTLGRERVEAAQAEAHHHNPALNDPFLSTREMFQLKFSAAARDAWLKLDAAGRKKFLSNTMSSNPLTVSDAEIHAWTEPRQIESIEWFASGEDLCRVMAEFLKRSDETALAILSKNPGLSFDPEKFRFVGFKGGSEPGVLSLNWLLQRKDQRWFVVSLTSNDRKNPLKENELLTVASGVVQELGGMP